MDSQLYFNFTKAIADYYNVDQSHILAGKNFNITIPQAHELGNNIQQRADFLSKINHILVKDLKGIKIHGAPEKGITGRVKGGRHLATLSHDENGYELFETDSGVLVPWQVFANFGSLGNKLFSDYAQYVQRQIALDRLKIGWNGKEVVGTTSADDLSDVNKGWLTLLKEQKPANILTGGATDNQIKIFGANADFDNLDELALDLKQGLDTRHQNRTDLVFLVGSDLACAESNIVAKKYALTPSEKAVIGSHNLMGSFGGMSAITPPNFPAKGAVVTTYDNLSIYMQKDTVHRRFSDDEDKKGLVDSFLRYEGYVVEDNGLMTAVEAENVVIQK
ncbi:phage major capsid protein, P2 family [Pasteurella skyensis]|uniref:Phage major capsid protein, P2 family n=1 Tax=Phocoenobacter skyensis TaxID=97481 RepID=A0AAJ6P1F2_9PAST|nr:phage major capsid protein, P2 family [Pasteurella skyensis]MDP8173672.1 phage major capsid protein, P2 family [Pasteurella skyensis]MDP8178040.1 phage major capsid protein, P2 family [Pasteurella skyensis]